ncbi:MAG: transcription termination/antitermination protein NusA [Epulopiscium sp.]|nr:transcription termination/antitermination protein NusA [Candidatus Epulonipiscium sp.]
MNNEFINALEQISLDKGIDKEILFEAIESSLVTACRRDFNPSQNVQARIDRDNGKVQIFAQKEVVEDEVVEDETLQISLSDALSLNASYEVGDLAVVDVTPDNFGRIAAQNAKQVVTQRIREAEREMVYNEYIAKEQDIISGLILRTEKRMVIVELEKTEAALMQNDQTMGEEYKHGERMTFYISEVKSASKGNKGAQVILSRNHPELVKRLFEHEVTEVSEGIVEIKSIAREAGSRTKIAVHSNEEDVDPVGACVGQNGQRVNIIVDELGGEKIDIIKWDEDPKVFIAAALSPSKVIDVILDEEEHSATVIVPDYQLSLAIGKEGQNARLAAKLTNWRIDIKSETSAELEEPSQETLEEASQEE